MLLHEFPHKACHQSTPENAQKQKNARKTPHLRSQIRKENIYAFRIHERARTEKKETADAQCAPG
jgi:hypothetical protein